MNKAFVREPEDDGRAYCPRCKTLGRPVDYAALDTHIRPESRSKMQDSAWFCAFPRCDVAYFNLFGGVVLMNELKAPVYPYDPTRRSVRASALLMTMSKPTSKKELLRASASCSPNQNHRKPTATYSPPMASAAWAPCKSSICASAPNPTNRSR